MSKSTFSVETPIKQLIEKLMQHENLSANDCDIALTAMLTPEQNPLQIAAFLALLRAKPETATEISAIVQALKKKMTSVPTSHRVLDIVGTGGDGMHTINISTGSALLAASCGVKIAKHGNRSVSSLTGSADVLEALGVNINLTPTQICQSIDEIGIGFCFSPNFHPNMQALRELRKQLNIPTTFNLLGPLLNPTNAQHILLGVLDKKLLPIIADVLIELGYAHSMVVHGTGLDEISCVGPVDVIEIKHNKKISYQLDPANYGLAYCQIADLRGGDATHNAALLRAVFRGQKNAIADTLAFNAAVALYLYGIHDSINAAMTHSKENLQSGAVLNLLNRWIEFSHA